MRSPIHSLLPIALCLSLVSSASALTEKETTQLINSVNHRLEINQDIKALDDLKTLPTKDAAGALLYFFQWNQHLYQATAKQKEIAARAAQLATELPDAEAYFTKLLKVIPDRPISVGRQNREYAVEALSVVRSKFSIRILGKALVDPELGLDVGIVGKRLAQMNIPSAPFAETDSMKASTPDAIAKWKTWWEASKSQY